MVKHKQMRLRRFGGGFVADERAVAFIEFALVVPIMVMLFLGGVDLARGYITRMRVDRASYEIANIVAQMTPTPAPGAGPNGDGEINGVMLQQLGGVLERTMGSLLPDPSTVKNQKYAIRVLSVQRGKTQSNTWAVNARWAVDINSYVSPMFVSGGIGPNGVDPGIKIEDPHMVTTEGIWNTTTTPNSSPPNVPICGALNVASYGGTGGLSHQQLQNIAYAFHQKPGMLYGENAIVVEVAVPVRSLFAALGYGYSSQVQTWKRLTIVHPRNGDLLYLAKQPSKTVNPNNYIGMANACPKV